MNATVEEFAMWWACWGDDDAPVWPDNGPDAGVTAVVPMPLAPSPLALAVTA